MHQGRAVKTHLSAWIDCHSRYIVEARYYVRETLDILIDSLLRAWTRQGASRELYVDNAKIYHANALVLACTQLNIQLLHRPPRDPPAGGLIERFIQTLQGQLEAEVRATQLLTLPDLNRDLQAWLDTAYHRQIHSETGQSPQERFQAACRFQRQVDLSAVQDFFCRREERTVHLDFSDVQIDNHWYAVDAKLRGERVVVQFDPFQTDDNLREVQLFSLTGTYLGVGKRYERQKGAHEQPQPPSPTGPVTDSYLQALRAEQAQAHQANRELGIDFVSARQRNIWPFSSFASRLAKLLGRSGGLSSFQAEELKVLVEFHARHDTLQEELKAARTA